MKSVNIYGFADVCKNDNVVGKIGQHWLICRDVATYKAAATTKADINKAPHQAKGKTNDPWALVKCK